MDFTPLCNAPLAKTKTKSFIKEASFSRTKTFVNAFNNQVRSTEGKV